VYNNTSPLNRPQPLEQERHLGLNARAHQQNHTDDAHTFRQPPSACISQLVKWLRLRGMQRFLSTDQGPLVDVLYRVSEHEASFHIPLHRGYARFLAECIQACGGNLHTVTAANVPVSMLVAKLCVVFHVCFPSNGERERARQKCAVVFGCFVWSRTKRLYVCS
jgi:hypothetical protein